MAVNCCNMLGFVAFLCLDVSVGDKKNLLTGVQAGTGNISTRQDSFSIPSNIQTEDEFLGGSRPVDFLY